MRIDHIGYAVQDLAAAAEKFEALGYRSWGEETEDPGRKVRIRFFSDPSGVMVELVAPLQEDSPVMGWVRKNGNSPYHICYESEDLEREIAELRQKGFILVHPIAPAPAMGGRRVAFLYSAGTGLLELAENPSPGR